MATKVDTPVCHLCRRPGPTRVVAFRQNVGVVLLRLTKKVEGPLCRGCIESSFSGMTLTTFFAGWWGLTSFLLTPFIVLSNIAEYSNACRSPELQKVPASGQGRKALRTMAVVTVVAAIAGISLVGGLVWFVGSSPSQPRYAERGSRAGAGDLREAEAKILVFKGQAAFGNTPEAERYATALSEKMALVRKAAFTGGRREGAPSLTDGHVLTYCEMRQGRVCFLVHVPELRNYGKGARETLAKMAWTLAQQTIESRPDTASLRLGVGLRGVLLYGIVMTGPAQGAAQAVSDDPAPLREFFVGPLASPATDTPAIPPAAPTAAPTAEPTPALPLAERLKRDIEAIGLSEPEPRHAAARDLESLGLAAVPALLKTAQDPAKSVEARATSMHLLGKSSSPEAVPVLLRCLEDRGAGHAAGEGIRYVKDAEQAVLPLLARGIEKRCTRRVESNTAANGYCWNALSTLGTFRTAASFAAPVVLAVMAAQEPGRGLQIAAITAAGNIGPAAKDAVPYMIKGLEHPDSYVKQESIRALERIGPSAVAAVPALEELRRVEAERDRVAEIDKVLATIRGTAATRP